MVCQEPILRSPCSPHQIGPHEHQLLLVCMLFTLPKVVIKKVNVICRSYLWHTIENNSFSGNIGWKHIYRPKKEGGLGIWNIEIWNLVAIWVNSHGIFTIWLSHFGYAGFMEYTPRVVIGFSSIHPQLQVGSLGRSVVLGKNWPNGSKATTTI